MVKASHKISGEIEGRACSDDLLGLQKKVRVDGDVHHEFPEMHPGAQVDGELKSLWAATTFEKSALKLAASNDV